LAGDSQPKENVKKP